MGAGRDLRADLGRVVARVNQGQAGWSATSALQRGAVGQRV